MPRVAHPTTLIPEILGDGVRIWEIYSGFKSLWKEDYNPPQLAAKPQFTGGVKYLFPETSTQEEIIFPYGNTKGEGATAYHLGIWGLCFLFFIFCQLKIQSFLVTCNTVRVKPTRRTTKLKNRNTKT